MSKKILAISLLAVASLFVSCDSKDDTKVANTQAVMKICNFNHFVKPDSQTGALHRFGYGEEWNVQIQVKRCIL